MKYLLILVLLGCRGVAQVNTLTIKYQNGNREKLYYESSKDHSFALHNGSLYCVGSEFRRDVKKIKIK